MEGAFRRARASCTMRPRRFSGPPAAPADKGGEGVKDFFSSFFRKVGWGRRGSIVLRRLEEVAEKAYAL